MQATKLPIKELMELIGCDEGWLIDHLKVTGIVEDKELYFMVTPEMVLTAVAAYYMEQYDEHLLSLN